MIYLGSPGRMVGISCPAEQRLSAAERYSFQTTLEGRVKAQVRPEGRRVWDLRLPRTSTPSEVATLAAFANGSWGPGPFWFVSADAPVVNLLTPGAAESDVSQVLAGGAVQGGPWDTAYGLAARSLLSPASSTLYLNPLIPVIQGQALTGSAVVQGDQARVGLSFYNAAGGWAYTSYGSRVSGDEVHRATVTTVPPAHAVAARLIVSPEVHRVTMPAVTWTDQVFEWGDGQGCETAVVLGGQRDLIQALDNPDGGRYADYSFTVQEVG